MYLGFYVTGEGALWCELHAEQATRIGGWAFALTDVPLALVGRITASNEAIRLGRPRPASLQTVKEELRSEITRDVLAAIAEIVIRVDTGEAAKRSLRSLPGGAT